MTGSTLRDSWPRRAAALVAVLAAAIALLAAHLLTGTATVAAHSGTEVAPAVTSISPSHAPRHHPAPLCPTVADDADTCAAAAPEGPAVTAPPASTTSRSIDAAHSCSTDVVPAGVPPSPPSRILLSVLRV